MRNLNYGPISFLFSDGHIVSRSRLQIKSLFSLIYRAEEMVLSEVMVYSARLALTSKLSDLHDLIRRISREEETQCREHMVSYLKQINEVSKKSKTSNPRYW